MQQPRGETFKTSALWSTAELWQHSLLTVSLVSHRSATTRAHVTAILAGLHLSVMCSSQSCLGVLYHPHMHPLISLRLPLHMLDLLITTLHTWFLCSVVIVGLNFSRSLKQLCFVLMSTNRHWFNGIPLLVCTCAVMMLQRSLFPGGKGAGVTCVVTRSSMGNKSSSA